MTQPIHEPVVSPATGQEFRFYSFVNALYLSEIQRGIQSFHVLHEVMNKVTDYQVVNPNAYDTFMNWSKNHKTVIVLNGGIVSDLLEINEWLRLNVDDMDFPVPFNKFNEDQQSLGGIITAVGCVVPEMYYDAVSKDKLLRMFKEGKMSPDYFEENLQGLTDGNFFWIKDGFIERMFSGESADGKFIAMMKSCPLA